MIRIRCEKDCSLDTYHFSPGKFYYMKAVDTFNALMYDENQTPVSSKRARIELVKKFFTVLTIELV